MKENGNRSMRTIGSPHLVPLLAGSRSRRPVPGGDVPGHYLAPPARNASMTATPTLPWTWSTVARSTGRFSLSSTCRRCCTAHPAPPERTSCTSSGATDAHGDARRSAGWHQPLGGAKTHPCSSPHDGQPHTGQVAHDIAGGTSVSRSVAAPWIGADSTSSAPIERPEATSWFSPVRWGARNRRHGRPSWARPCAKRRRPARGLGRLQRGKVGVDPVEAHNRW